jgi:integral membrane protein (TIGR01906 family)
MKLIRNVLFWLIVCCIPLLLISSNLRWGMTEIRIYEYGIDTYPITAITGIAKPELMNIHQHLIDYYNSKTDTAQIAVKRGEKIINVFNEKELIHLKDVKNLYILDWTVQIVTFFILSASVLLMLFLLKEKWLLIIKGIFWGSGVTLALMVFLAFWSLFGFEQLFVLFHRLSFTNEFWILDPSKDYLIMLFPGEFFYDIALFGFAAIVLQSLVLGGIVWTILKIKKA